MKLVLTVIRLLTGILFIFSGLVKAIDPKGLSYKMQEFFEAWATSGFMPKLMHGLSDYALAFSLVMITLEVIVGIGLLLGWRPKLLSWLLLLLMLFFTFLTSYVLFSGKIRACGCFGDCIPITPIQTFTKDIILLVFAIILLAKHKWITPVFSGKITGLLMMLGLFLTIFLQMHILKHLPLVDCLPFKKGNNILELRKMPPNAIMDEYNYEFVYEKGSEKKSFDPSSLPDSSWTFVDRNQVLVKKGSNNIPLINDFLLTNSEDADVTESTLSNLNTYFLLFIRELPGTNNWVKEVQRIKQVYPQASIHVITSHRNEITKFLADNNLAVTDILTCDGTAIKTAARVIPTLFKMKGSVIEGKWAGADFNEIK